jgi:hypothetical protein
MRVRILPEYPGYVLSDDGRIQGRSGRWLKPRTDSGGYQNVALHNGGGNKTQKTVRVHILMARAFLGDPPTPQHEVCHDNGDRTDNRAANLRWGTRAENMADKIRHGTRQTGERHGQAKLTWEAVRYIRAHPETPARDLATRFGVKVRSIYSVLRFETWNDVSSNS